MKRKIHIGMGQNHVTLVKIKIAGKWMFIPLKMVCIGIYPYTHNMFFSTPGHYDIPGL